MTNPNFLVTHHEDFISLLPVQSPNEDGFDEFEAVFLEALQEGVKHVVLDVINVDYLYSNAVSFFIRCYKILKEKDREMVIINSSPLVRNVLESVNLHKIILLFDNFDEFYRWQNRISASSHTKTAGEQLAFDVTQKSGLTIISILKPQNRNMKLMLERDFEEIFDSIQNYRIIADLSEAGEIDTVTITAFLSFARAAKDRSGKFVIVGLGRANMGLFQLLDIESAIEFSDNVENAMKLFRA